MAFVSRFLGFFNPTLAGMNKMEEKHNKKIKERGRAVVGMLTESKFREKYFEARRVLEKGGLSDLEKNRMLKRAIFFRDVSRGVIALNSKEEEAFLEEDKRIKNLIENEEEQ